MAVPSYLCLFFNNTLYISFQKGQKISGARKNLAFPNRPCTFWSFLEAPVPNFAAYYNTALLAQLPKYHAVQETPLWVTLEIMDCDALSVANLLWLLPADCNDLTNPITRFFWATWEGFKMAYGLQSSDVLLLSFLQNPSFYWAWSLPNSFRPWTAANLIRLHKFTASTSFETFCALCKSHGLPTWELFQYLQIKYFIAPYIGNNSPICFEWVCQYQLYTLRYLLSPTPPSPPYVAKWEADLGYTLEAVMWKEI